MKKIAVNCVKCLKCNDYIYSQSRHDFCYCSCGSIAVDGGTDYLKRSGDINNYQEASIFVAVDDEDYTGKFLIWAPSGDKNSNTVFSDFFSAEKTAKTMKEKFKKDFYVVEIKQKY